MERIWLFVTHKEAFGQVIPLDSIQSMLKGINLHECLRVLVPISLALDVHGHGNPHLQQYVARKVLPPQVSTVVLPLLSRRPQQAVCCKQQVLTLMKLSFLNCPSDSGARFEEDRETKERFFRECLLGILDHLDGEEFIEDLESITSLDAQERKLTGLVLRLESLQLHEQYRYALPRHYELFIEIPQRRELKGHPNAIDFEQLFREATGLGLRPYLYLGLTLVARYQAIDFTKSSLSWQDILIDPGRWFPSAVPPGEVERFWSNLALDTDGFRRALQAESSDMDHLFHSFLTFERWPLYMSKPDTCLPLDLSFLRHKISSGLFWQIDSYLLSKDQADWREFREFFGGLFQAYVSDLLSRAIPTRSPLVQRLFLDLKYDKPEKRASDAILIDFIEGTRAVLIDAKGKRPKKVPTYIRGDIESYDQDICEIVLRSAQQIDRVIKDFEAGQFGLGQFTFGDIDYLYPLVVAPQPIPQMVLLGKRIEETVARSGFLARREVAPIQVVSIEELEMIAALMQSEGYCFSSILRDKLASRRFRHAPMKDFLLLELLQGRREPTNEHLVEKAKAIASEAKEYLGLSQS